MFYNIKIVVLLTAIIILNECKPNKLRCSNFCQEGIAIDYEDSSQQGMTYKHSNQLKYSISLIYYLFQQIELASTCKELGFKCETDFAEGYSDEPSDEPSDDLKLSMGRLKTNLSGEIEFLANEQQDDESLKPTAIDVQVG